MSIEITKESKLASVSAAAEKVMSHSFNRRMDNKTSIAAFVLSRLGANLDKVDDLLTFLKEERERMKKGVVMRSDDFGHYYGKTLIEDIEELVKTVEDTRTEKTVFPTKEIVGQALYLAIKNNFMFRDFNFKNYEFLRRNNLVNLISDFNTNFRGDIVELHESYNGKYKVIETLGTRKGEVGETKFYIVQKHKSGENYLDNCVYRSYEDAFFALVCPQYSSAMSALLIQSKVSE